MVNTATVVPEGQHFILSSLSPGRAQRRLALAIVLALLVVFFITAGPLSTTQAGRVDAFVPAYATAIFLNDSMNAVLLFSQFPHPALASPPSVSRCLSFGGPDGNPGDAHFSGRLPPGWPAWRRA